jgi:hypothetical protein
MSCHGLCHRCPCTDDLIGDMERSLSSMINGLERYLEDNGIPKSKTIYDYFPNLKLAKATLSKSRIPRTF